MKYPRTYHLPFSPGRSSDDKVLTNYQGLAGRTVVVTEKMDGENTTLYSNHIHARSLDSRNHPSRDWVKNFHASIAYTIPIHMRLCVENLYAKHSIYYQNLSSFIYGLNVWSGDTCHAWDDTVEQFTSRGIPIPIIFYRGPFDESVLEKLASEIDTETVEGFVVRDVDSFKLKDFSIKVAKWVRDGHVQTDEHWLHGPIIKNKLGK